MRKSFMFASFVIKTVADHFTVDSRPERGVDDVIFGRRHSKFLVKIVNKVNMMFAV